MTRVSAFARQFDALTGDDRYEFDGRDEEAAMAVLPSLAARPHDSAGWEAVPDVDDWDLLVAQLAARRARREEIERSRAIAQRRDPGAQQERDERKMHRARIVAAAEQTLDRPGFHGELCRQSHPLFIRESDGSLTRTDK